MASPPRRRGRPRSESARKAILRATWELLERDGFASLSTQAIAERAGASKATLYRWWPNKAAVAMDAFLAATEPQIEFRRDLPLRDALKSQVRALLHVFADTSTGPALAALIAEARSDPDLATALRERYLVPRRTAAADVLRRGIEAGALRDMDIELLIDAIYGPVYYRLVLGHPPLDPDLADSIVDIVMDGAGLTPGSPGTD